MPVQKDTIVSLYDAEITETFDKRHLEYIQEAEQRGEDDGNRNQPAVEDETVAPYEKNLRAKYQTAISDVHKQGCQWLQEIYDNKVKIIEKQQRDIKEDPEFVQNKINTALDDRDRQLKEITENHSDRLKEIENEPSWRAVEKDFSEHKSRFQKIAEKHGRNELYVHMKTWVYFALLGFIAVCEIPINYQVFVSFRETPILTLIMAGVLVISLPFLAHGSGKFLRQFKENMIFLVLLLVSIVLIVSLSYYTAVLRMHYLSTKEGILPEQLTNDFWTFFIISLVLFFVGMIASFLAHDPSIEFTEVHRNYVESKKRYDQKNAEKHGNERAERERYEQEKQKLFAEYTRVKNEWDSMSSTLDRKYSEVVAEHDKLLVYLQGFEKKINGCFKQAIQTYRDKNLTFRNNHAQPRSWQHEVTDLEFEFRNMKELSENPRM